MAGTSKLETQIEVKPPPPPPFLIENLQEQTVLLSFFKSDPRSWRRDTWITAVLLIIPIIAFTVTMFVNDCWRNSHRECALKALGRFSFQPLSENPLLGPSASTLDEMGAFRRTFLREHQMWRFFAFQCLHAGVIPFVINLSSVAFVGFHLEREFGPLRVGIIYLFSAFSGTLVAALFVQNKPTVGSSGALYGLLGAALSELIWNWRMYTDKLAALALLLSICMINLAIGLLPYVDNFASIGGFIAGILIGAALLCSYEMQQKPQNKGKGSDQIFIKLKLKHKLEWSGFRTFLLVLFCLLFAGCLVAVLYGVDMNVYCSWCQHVNCVPTKRWSCEDREIYCQDVLLNRSRLNTMFTVVLELVWKERNRTLLEGGQVVMPALASAMMRRFNEFARGCCNSHPAQRSPDSTTDALLAEMRALE
ncbi:Peptidase S54, rhomboid [Parasponia andersonii]|uniref:RHOMBOID-like protein n=1 Tax=Parasponia andersonii TaxID=3476 RepID=A0A2P5BW94_PARAD|nr:Peptidase S54, rhomboid [Parasponia andersonii]